MIRTFVLTLAIVGISPAVLLALFNLMFAVASVVYRPISLSFRLYRPGQPEQHVDLGSALLLSPTTSLLIVVGAGILLLGIARVQPGVIATQEATSLGVDSDK